MDKEKRPGYQRQTIRYLKDRLQIKYTEALRMYEGADPEQQQKWTNEMRDWRAGDTK